MPILVVNPNSSVPVTRSIAEALAPLGDMFEVIRRADGPETIRTDEDVAAAGLAFVEIAEARPDAAGFITACFSDPGLDLARRRVGQPVTGAQEAAVLEACARAERFGVIALSERAIPRHMKRIDALGLIDKLVGEAPLRDASAEDSGSEQLYAQLRDLAYGLRERGAGAVVLGCAGMARQAARLEDELGIAVIDPVAAAGRLALGRLGSQEGKSA
ncbi:MAG: aspartate/glutamate racemase family protein [Flavobacteriaceae bacterium]